MTNLVGINIPSPPSFLLSPSPLQQWHRRFFVLWSTKLMEYYTTREKKPADYCKTIDLSKCEDMLAPIPTNNRMHVIKLIIRKSDDRVREYLFDCESEAEMNCWVTFLAQVCGFMAGTSVPALLIAPFSFLGLSSLAVKKNRESVHG